MILFLCGAIQQTSSSFSKHLQEKVAAYIPCWNYSGIYDLSFEQLVEWAVLDTYDALAAKYDYPLSRMELVQMLYRIPDIRFSVKRGGNGLEANITRL